MRAGIFSLLYLLLGTFEGGSMIICSLFFVSAPWNTDMMAGVQATTADTEAMHCKQHSKTEEGRHYELSYYSWTTYLCNVLLAWKIYILLSCLFHCYFWIFLLQCIQSNPIPSNKWLSSNLTYICQYIVYCTRIHKLCPHPIMHYIYFIYSVWNYSLHLTSTDHRQWLPRWLSANPGDVGLIPGSGRSPGEGNGYPLQYSCLENAMDRGAWQATVCGVTKSGTWLSNFHFQHH